MSNLSLARKRKTLRAFLVVVLILGIIFGACAIYVSDYYHANTEAIEAFASMGNVEKTTLDDGTLVFLPETAVAGFIFYPGGKVEYTAYEPLMAACAERGILCALVEMPFNLAVLDVNAADGIKEKYPDIESWYIGGHSLGGSMAASYLSKHTDEFDGLVLLGSYSTSDISSADISVLSVYGSEDKVMNREKYSENISNLPSDFTELIIEGGSHAYFGMYGAQDGDGIPTISNEEQIIITADAILKLMLGISKDAFENLNKDRLSELANLENKVDDMKRDLTSSHFVRLAEGNCSMEVSPYYSSAVAGLERVADHLVNVGHSIVNPVGSQKEN